MKRALACVALLVAACEPIAPDTDEIGVGEVRAILSFQWFALVKGTPAGIIVTRAEPEGVVPIETSTGADASRFFLFEPLDLANQGGACLTEPIDSIVEQFARTDAWTSSDRGPRKCSALEQGKPPCRIACEDEELSPSWLLQER